MDIRHRVLLVAVAVFALPLLGGLTKLTDRELDQVTGKKGFAFTDRGMTVQTLQRYRDLRKLAEQSRRAGEDTLYPPGKPTAVVQLDDALRQLRQNRIERQLRRERLTPDDETVRTLKQLLRDFDVTIHNGESAARIRFNSRSDGFDTRIDFNNGESIELNKNYNSPDIQTQTQGSDGRIQNHVFQ